MARPPSYSHLTFSQLIGRNALLQWIKEHLEKCDVNGSYFEFGVLNGESMTETYFVLRDQVDRYIGFDSFKGLPKLSELDHESIKLQPSFYEGNYSSTDYDVIKKIILASGMPQENLLLVEGFLENTLTKELQESLDTNRKASVVHLDVDLYVSTKQALDFIYPFLQTGTWLMCDDYWTYAGSSSCGTQKALSDFLEEHPDIKIQEYCSYRGWSKAFIVEVLR